MKSTKNRQIKSKHLSILLIVTTIFFTVDLMVISFLCSQTYQKLNEVINYHMELQQDVYNLQDGSDYLTEQVRLFVVTDNRLYFDNFYNEVNVTRRRNNALDSIANIIDDQEVLNSLEQALQYSNELLKIEEKAMRLEIESKEMVIEDFMPPLSDVSLEEHEMNLSNAEKGELARDLVFNEEYVAKKHRIYDSIQSAMDSVLENVNAQKSHLISRYSHLLWIQNIIVCVLLVLIILFIVMFIGFFVNPLSKIAASMENKETVEIEGPYEMQLLAQSYNEMLTQIESDQQELSYEATHDALTGVYNRKVFDEMREKLTGYTMIVIDVDYFKTVNDTYGHDTGDRLLKKAADLLKSSFRNEDYVCRIGGDEFAVLMVNTGSQLKELIERKLDSVSKRMMDDSDGLPANTLSIGVAFADRENPSDDIFIDCDKALYEAKESGRGTYRFY
ncbi:MAG: sensor domain-containing diguanylate cyclase [Erysipelotrichaceae bacterium]|nr:sensor domain-containing diguanylate cyclase [Erysipelotrichaceae bacterium]